MSDGRLVPQPHGGALLAGGQPGNAGGTGRPPSALDLRGDMRTLLGQALNLLREVVETTDKLPPEGISMADYLRAVKILADAALKQERGARFTFADLERLAEATANAVHAHVSEPSEARQVLEAVECAWLPIVAERG